MMVDMINGWLIYLLINVINNDGTLRLDYR